MATFAMFIAQLLFFGLLFFIGNKLWKKYRDSLSRNSVGQQAFVKMAETAGSYTGGIVITAGLATGGLHAMGWLDSLPWLDIIKLMCQMFGGCA